MYKPIALISAFIAIILVALNVENVFAAILIILVIMVPIVVYNRSSDENFSVSEENTAAAEQPILQEPPNTMSVIESMYGSNPYKSKYDFSYSDMTPKRYMGMFDDRLRHENNIRRKRYENTQHKSNPIFEQIIENDKVDLPWWE